ncbi:MAG TPA: metallothionein [Gammaproteobacteria bacterium]|nr:metallothionein [Gammaproteobacteria bacterium]
MAGQGRCSHHGCSCTVEEPHAVLQRGKAYCSDGCAAGRGCEHGDCDCRPHDAAPARSD